MLSFLFGLFSAYFAWGNSLTLTILSLSLFLVYLLLPKRVSLFLFALGYYAMASRGLLVGAESFVGSSTYAFGVWSGAVLISSLAWVIVWSGSFQKRLYLFPLALLLVTLPPVGFISWVNPLASVAVLFPDFGFRGLVLGLGLVYVIAFLLKSFYKTKNLTLIKKVTFIASAALVSFLVLIGIHFFMPPKVPKSHTLIPINADLAYTPRQLDRRAEYKRVQYFFRRVQEHQGNRFLLPENALGNYSEIQSMVWSRLDKHKVVYAGANIYNATGTQDQNLLLRLEHNASEIIYTQRIPVLFTMWKPFTGQGTKATLYEQAVIQLEGEKAGVFICYEQLLTFPYLQTMFYEPDVLLGISNLYWAKETNIKVIQEQVMQLWAILFGVPLVFGVNG